MKESTIIHELRNLHKRCEQLTMANNMLTKAFSNIECRLRAYENKINSGIILKRILPLRKIEAEVQRIKAEDVTLQEQINRAQQMAFEQQAKKVKVRNEDAKAKKVVKQKQKQVQKLVKNA